MTTAILRAKGQITIPAEVRNALNLQVGDRITFVEIAPKRYEIITATGEVTALKGMFGLAKQRISIEKMNAVIAQQGAQAR